MLCFYLIIKYIVYIEKKNNLIFIFIYKLKSLSEIFILILNYILEQIKILVFKIFYLIFNNDQTKHNFRSYYLFSNIF